MTRLSRRRMICILPPSHVSKCISFSVFLCVAGTSLLTGEGRRGWGRSQIIRWTEGLVLCRSFNTLCFQSSSHDTTKNAYLPARKLVNPEAFVCLVRICFDIVIDIDIAGHDRAREESIEQWPLLMHRGNEGNYYTTGGT
jgi:hypothetical protein